MDWSKEAWQRLPIDATNKKGHTVFDNHDILLVFEEFDFSFDELSTLEYIPHVAIIARKLNT